MPVIVKECDITRFKGDAIVNSIGGNGENLGPLCRKILTKINDLDLINYIINKNRVMGYIDITEAGKLACSNIIHVTPPYKDMNDDNNTLLTNICKEIINVAIEKGYKSIAIPLIGSGGSGYTKGESYNAIMNAALEIVKKEEKENVEILNITIVPYIRKIQRERSYSNKKESLESARYFPKEYEALPIIHPSGIFGTTDEELYDFVLPNTKEKYTAKEVDMNVKNILKAIQKVNIDEFLVPKYQSSYEQAFNFIFDYMMQNNIDENILTIGGLGTKRKSRIINRNKMVKEDVFKLSFILKMSFSQLVQFMALTGHTFDPFDTYDMFYLNYMFGKYKKVNGLVDLDILAYGHGVTKSFQFPDEK